MEQIKATYWIETSQEVQRAVDVMAGEQSCGTFVKVAGETAELTARHRAKIEWIEILRTTDHPSLPGGRAASGHTFTQARVRLAWPLENVGASLPNLLATVAGNLFELAEFSGLRLLDLELPRAFGASFAGPRFGVAGTRRLAGVNERPLLGTIIKPSVGLDPAATAERVAELIEAGLDFLKDDELMADPPHCPFSDRVQAVMKVINAYADRHGRKPMFAFNLSGDVDEMRRRHDEVLAQGGTCVMASLQWVGLSGIRALTAHTVVPLHGHRNGWGLFYRSPAVGISYTVMQQIWRLAGVDHLHCNGLRNKFCESDASVTASARACLTPLFRPDDAAMPVISSGQWAEQAHDTLTAVGSSDLLYVCGGGIVGHPGGIRAGVDSVRQAWAAALAGVPLHEAAAQHVELRDALTFFGGRR
jgi:ribulose-bisphosphate carboxylase large chain